MKHVLAHLPQSVAAPLPSGYGATPHVDAAPRNVPASLLTGSTSAPTATTPPLGITAPAQAPGHPRSAAPTPPRPPSPPEKPVFAPPVDHRISPEVARVLRTTALQLGESAGRGQSPAKAIVTRMGRDPQGLGGEAIERGPAGIRPEPAPAPTTGAPDAKARARMRSAGAGAEAGRAATIPDGNHGDNLKEATA